MYRSHHPFPTWLRYSAWQLARINFAIWGALYIALNPESHTNTKGVASW